MVAERNAHRMDDRATEYLFDPWESLGPKRRKLPDKSWAWEFRRHIFPNLPVAKPASFKLMRVGVGDSGTFAPFLSHGVCREEAA